VTLRNVWAFSVDDRLWLPVPRPEARTGDLDARWLAAAKSRAAFATGAEGEALDAVLSRCADILDRGGDDERCVFFPVQEQFPLEATFLTLSPDEHDAELALWQSEEDAVSVETTDYEHEYFESAVRVMRIVRESGGVVARVAFFGRARPFSFALTASSDHLLVAGQFADVALPLFGSLRPRDGVTD